MKKVILAFCLCFVLFLSAVGGTLTVYASDSIDPEREASLTLQYKHGEQCFTGLEIKTYRIASVTSDGAYELAGAFADYPVNIYGVESQAEWRDISSTLSAYAEADGIEPTCTAITDETGTAAFSDILPGMYLTLSVRAESDSDITVFEKFLTAVPQPADDGSYNYDVTAYPKCETQTPQLSETEYKVVKQWRDNGYTHNRPDSITVDILKDGEIQFTEVLSADNNWSYRWTAADDGSVWQAVERDIPENYTVTVVKNGGTFMITNLYDYGVTRPPQTGDTTVIWHYALGMAGSGGVILILTAWRRRTET